MIKTTSVQLFVQICLLNCASLVLAQSTPTLVIDDTTFWGKMPLKDQITDTAEQEADWLFNNSALRLLSMSNLETELQIPEAGTYYIYTRSKAAGRNQSFRISLGTKFVSQSITTTGDKFVFQRVAQVDLPKGEIQLRVTRIFTSPTLDFIVLSKNGELKEDEVKPLQGRPDVKLVKEYKVPPPLSFNFGDVNSDGKLDLFIQGFGYSATVIDNDGHELWTYKAPEVNFAARSTDDINGLIYDLENDGKPEVIHWRMIDGVECIAVVDALTGELKYKTPWPTTNNSGRRSYNNHRLAIAHFGPTPKDNTILCYSDPGGGVRLDAFTPDLKPVWSHAEPKQKDHLGHNPYIVDLNKDGVDEVLVSAMLLDNKGKVIWNRYDIFNDNHDHADQSFITDLNNDGKPELVCGWSDVGVVALDAMTGEILWWQQAEHTQRIRAGNFLDGIPSPQVVAGPRFYGNRQFEPYLWAQVKFFDAKGKLLSNWPEFPLNCNPKMIKGDWDGDGGDDLFWFKFHFNRQGKGEYFFPQQVYTMFDFSGDKAEEVVTWEGDSIKIWGSSKADHSNPKFGRDAEYLRNKGVNIEH